MDNPSQDFVKLPLPSTEDGLETTLCKAQALSEAVQKGQSLALRTGQHLPEHAAARRNAKSIAMSTMTIQERQSYHAWKAGRHLIPDINWTENGGVVRSSSSGRGRWMLSGEDENRMRRRGRRRRGDDGHARDSSVKARAGARATPENALWLTLNIPAMLPLIKAVVRVSNAEKQASPADWIPTTHCRKWR